MAKLYMYVMITIGLMVLLELSGIGTLGGFVATHLGINYGNIGNFKASALFIAFAVSGIAALAAAGIIMGIYGRGSADIAAAAGVSTPLVGLIGEMISIVVYAKQFSWAGYFIFLFFAPLIAGYSIALFEWVRGRD